MMIWKTAYHEFTFPRRPLVMGIVNVTPDSFSDGGKFSDPNRAIEQGLKLAAEGADILDIGGESTRPGAMPVPEEEELRRVVPVIHELFRQSKVILSIDTMKAGVAKAAIDAGASIVNDVSGLRDPAMVEVCQETNIGIIVMHMQGTPQTMQVSPQYSDVVAETVSYFRERIQILHRVGIDPQRICLDPGIGFGKKFDQTMSQLRRLGEYASLGRPICLGVSRKGFLGQVTGRDRSDRLAGTLAVNSFAMANGHAQIVRVHDVAAHVDAVKLWESVYHQS